MRMGAASSRWTERARSMDGPASAARARGGAGAGENHDRPRKTPAIRARARETPANPHLQPAARRGAGRGDAAARPARTRLQTASASISGRRVRDGAVFVDQGEDALRLGQELGAVPAFSEVGPETSPVFGAQLAVEVEDDPPARDSTVHGRSSNA